MKRYIPIYIAAVLMLGGCSNLGSTLNIIGTDLGVVAADLPTACGNLSVALTAVAGLSGLSAAQSAAITTGVNKYSTYCGPTAGAVADTAAAVADIAAAVQALQGL